MLPLTARQQMLRRGGTHKFTATTFAKDGNNRAPKPGRLLLRRNSTLIIPSCVPPGHS